MPEMKRILIVDDHAVLRQGLRQIIETTVDMIVADEAESGDEALNKTRDNEYDMVILDISMPGRDGLDVLVAMKKLKPQLPVIVLSAHPEQQYALRAYKAGAAGYLPKSSPPGEIITALEKVALGKKYVTPEMAERMVSNLTQPGQAQLHNTLSNREYQVLRLIASGKPVGKIAVELSLSVKTISSYRSFILRKMNMKNNAELTRYAIESNLI